MYLNEIFIFDSLTGDQNLIVAKVSKTMFISLKLCYYISVKVLDNR